ncbi:MAG: lipopolysaccharide biosynthesis protein [Lachnospiraceae bacterium]
MSLIFYVISIALSFFSRKIFLGTFGAEFIGLGGTISEILGFLSLAELGISTAISYNLYKPLQQGDKPRIEELVSVIGYLYRKIGLFIFCAGVVISAFIPLIFKDTPFSLGLIYFGFYAILSSAVCTYLINYRQIILSADQKNYVVTAYLQTAGIVKTLIQMAVAYYWGSFYIWFALDLIFALIACVILNKRIHSTYPWLKASVKKGKDAFPQNIELLAFTKKVFVHKMKDFLLNRTDQVMIFAFVSLKMVAYYGNYVLVVSKVSTLLSSALDSFSAGVGNLVAEGDKDREISVFWELIAVRFMVGGVMVFGIYCFIEPFITLWLGNEYVLSHWILVMLMINIFIMQVRGPVDMFNSAYGHYADVWAAWAEGIINVSVTLIAAPFLGICGILLGKIVSLLAIVVIWKPIYLYRDGFKLPLWQYWRNLVPYYLCFAASFVLGLMIYKYLPLDAYANFAIWIAKLVVCCLAFGILYFLLLLLISKGARDIKDRLFAMVVTAKNK